MTMMMTMADDGDAVMSRSDDDDGAVMMTMMATLHDG